MMVHNQFQALPATVVLLGQDNPPTCIAIDAKDKHAAQIEVKRVQAAAEKQKSANSTGNIQPNTHGVYSCSNTDCRRIFLRKSCLKKHMDIGKCSITKTHRLKSRSKKIVTKKNGIRDVAVRFLVKKGFTNTATVIERSKVNSPASHVDVSNKRKVYTLCSGETKWKAKIIFHQPGFARKICWSSRTRYTEKQIDFLRWAFGLGLKNINQKLTAEKAAALMKVVGTEEGAKLYPKDKYMAKAKDGSHCSAEVS